MTEYWTAREDELLVRWWNAGVDADLIAIALCHARVAVNRRVRELRAEGRHLSRNRVVWRCPHCLSRPKAHRPDGRLATWCEPCETAEYRSVEQARAAQSSVRSPRELEQARLASARYRDRVKAKAAALD